MFHKNVSEDSPRNAKIMEHSLPKAMKEEEEQTMTKQMPHKKPLIYRERRTEHRNHIGMEKTTEGHNQFYSREVNLL